MNEVQLREAKAKLSALVEAAERGEPTTITKHGSPAAMLVPIEAGHKLYAQEKPNLIDYLMSMPEDLPLRRDQSRPRPVDL